jgi:hypothetical protein
MSKTVAEKSLILLMIPAVVEGPDRRRLECRDTAARPHALAGCCESAETTKVDFTAPSTLPENRQRLLIFFPFPGGDKHVLTEAEGREGAGS